jgi:hypothetical protein
MTDLLMGYLREYGGFDVFMIGVWVLARAIGRIGDFDRAIDLQARLKHVAIGAGTPARQELVTLLAHLDELRYAFTLSRATGIQLRRIGQSYRAYQARLSEELPYAWQEVTGQALSAYV